MNTKIISINNQKGGVGKTTTAISMAAALTEKGYNVLLVDCDGSSTTLTKILSKQAGIIEPPAQTLTDLVLMRTMDRDISAMSEDVVIKCPEGYSFIPADTSLVSSSTTLAFQNNLEIRFKTMKNILDHFRGLYDYILLDAAPVLDIFSLNQLIASDELIIVSQCQQASQAAIGELLNSVNQFVKAQNNIRVKGILITMLDRRSNYGQEQINAMQNAFPKIKVFDAVIPRSVAAERYVDDGHSCLINQAKGAVATAYRDFVNEYLRSNDD